MSTSDINNSYQIIYENLLTKILKPIFKKIEISNTIFIKINKNCLSDNPDFIVLYNII